MDAGPCTAPRRCCRSRRRSGAETTSVTVVGGRAAAAVAASSSRQRGGSRVVGPGGERACVGGDQGGWGARGVGEGTLTSGCRGGDCCRSMPIGSRLPCCGRRGCHRALGRAQRWGEVPGGKGVHPTGAPPPPVRSRRGPSARERTPAAAVVAGGQLVHAAAALAAAVTSVRAGGSRPGGRPHPTPRVARVGRLRHRRRPAAWPRLPPPRLASPPALPLSPRRSVSPRPPQRDGAGRSGAREPRAMVAAPVARMGGGRRPLCGDNDGSHSARTLRVCACVHVRARRVRRVSRRRRGRVLGGVCVRHSPTHTLEGSDGGGGGEGQRGAHPRQC